MTGSAPHFLVVENAWRSAGKRMKLLMKTENLKTYTAPELEDVKFELDGTFLLKPSLKPGESEGGEEGDES